MKQTANPKTISAILIAATTLLIAVTILPQLSTNAFAASPNLIVNSVDSSGNPLTGYWTVVSQSGTTVKTGFTPLSATLAAGTYDVTVGDYGGYYFNHWSDGTTTRDHSVTIGTTGTTILTAVYSTTQSTSTSGSGTGTGTNGGGTTTSSSTITVSSQYSDGSALSGMYIVLSQNGATVNTGFTPTSFTVTSGQQYTVTAEDYGSASFSHWQDGTTSRSITVTAGAALTAVYTNNGSGSGSGTSTSSGGSGGDGTGPSPAGSDSITVYAKRIPSSYWAPCFATSCSAGTGPGAKMFFSLEDSSGNVVQTGFADENGYSFTGLNPQAQYYLVYPSDCDYCHNDPHNVVFSHWQDGSTDRPRAVDLGQSVTAYFEYVPLQ